MAPNAIRVDAHAKINLHLAILGRRPDGYHDVETVLQTLALHDTLTCEACDGPFVLRCDAPDVPIDDGNLVWRAGSLLAEAAGLGAPAKTRVTIEKRIPMQAGLGGGSADAAAALIGLARLWRIDVDGVMLRGLAARLGADVPFFLEGGTALGTGRGDRLQPLPDFPVSAVLIVMPPFGVSTADAYRWHDEQAAGDGDGGAACAPPPDQAQEQREGEDQSRDHDRDQEGAAALRWPAATAQWWSWLPRCRNDFEPVVGARLAAVPETVAALRAAGAHLAAMSGSGAAVFGLFDRLAAAESAAAAFDRPGWRTFVSQTVGRASYQAAIPTS